jgi:hypothetical protein
MTNDHIIAGDVVTVIHEQEETVTYFVNLLTARPETRIFAGGAPFVFSTIVPIGSPVDFVITLFVLRLSTFPTVVKSIASCKCP